MQQQQPSPQLQPQPQPQPQPQSQPSHATASANIPQFVVVHDQLQQSWKHPIVHYVFDDEPIPPNVPRDRCVVVNFAEDGEHILDATSFSHRFQVTDCKISSTPQIGTASGKESAASVMLTIEGMAATGNLSDHASSHKYGDDQDAPTLFGLDESVQEYKRRNELLRQVVGVTDVSGDT